MSSSTNARVFRKCDRETFSLKFDLFDDSESDDNMFLKVSNHKRTINNVI